MTKAYYNENDKYAAEWLRNLIFFGLIADGDVDERSIEDVTPKDLEGYTQCHFFAGIGGWSYALRLAGWPDDHPVWTGSCPCQPFSAAGKGKGAADERHLWPAWFHLIAQCQPGVVFGEQVEAAINHGWLDLVQSDLEGKGYAFAPVGIPAAGVGAPHIRQRLWFVADTEGERQRSVSSERHSESRIIVAWTESRSDSFNDSEAGELGDAEGREQRRLRESNTGERREMPTGRSSPWSHCDWLPCRDGKARPVEPGTFPLAHGIPARVGRLRGYGNAIVPQVAAEVIRAYMEISLTKKLP